MNRLLLRQIKRVTGITDDTALERLVGELGKIGQRPDLSPEAAALLGNFGVFLASVEGAYAQHDRDLALRTRSLELSSEELTAANERLREDLLSRNRALKSLRETALGLLADDASATSAASLATNDLESLTILMAQLVEQREAQRRELDSQRFALDQHAIVSITDAAGNILYANQRFCDITGYSQEELIGQNHRIVKSGQHPPEVFAGMWNTISAGQVWHGELCNRKKDGSHYWVAATIVPFLDAAGLPTRYIGIRTDITERKAMEARIQEQLLLVEELVEAIPLPLYFKDTGGRYLRINRAFELFFSARREDLLGKTLHELLSPEDAGIHLEKDAELLRTGGSQVYEARVVSRDGIVHDTIYRKAALTRPDGSISGLLGAIVDITERREAEQALRQAMETAEAANRAKSEFLANMSHEIRTPMNGVIGMTELTLGTKLDDEQREYLQIAKSSAESLLTIINDILDFSKIEAGKLAIERISFHLPRLVSETAKSLALRAHEKNLELIIDLDPTLASFVMGDPGRLRQVLVNLIGNAIKFTEKGEIVVRVRKHTGNIIRFEIRDSGIGIAADKLGLIFDAFVQEDTSTTRRFGGTGLGLTICNRLAGMMGGRIRAESTLGQGSTFHVELPLPPDVARTSEPSPLASLDGLTALIVDDNATNRLILSETLASWGMQVSASSSATEALAALQADPLPALIVLDAHMPDIDGFELAARLQADARLARVPRIMLSSGATGTTGGEGGRCQSPDIAAYFTKPVARQELLAGVHAVLGHPPAAAIADSPVTRHSLREDRQTLSVLLVEDHAINQKLAISLLEKWGHRVTLAENGQLALDRVAEQPFDLILMDLQMPVMSGIEATQRLRLAGCTTRIVAMTANAMEGDREFCLEAGMDDYIAKPIKADELHALIHRPPASGNGSAGGPADTGFDYAGALATADQEIVEVIAPLFLEACEDNLSSLRRALAAGDEKLALREAHTLRGLVANFNAIPAIEQARAIENALQRADIDTARGAMPAFEAALGQLIAVLREHGQIR